MPYKDRHARKEAQLLPGFAPNTRRIFANQVNHHFPPLLRGILGDHEGFHPLRARADVHFEYVAISEP